MDDETKKLLSMALKALCLTRDYVGEECLPAIDGWEWYDTGKKISDIIPNDEWAHEFRLRINKPNIPVNNEIASTSN